MIWLSVLIVALMWLVLISERKRMEQEKYDAYKEGLEVGRRYDEIVELYKEQQNKKD